MPAFVRDRRGGHWAWFHHAVIDDYGPEIGPYGIAVYVCLCRHADREEATFVGQKTVANEIGAGRTSVNQAVARLKALGLIEVEDRQDEHGRTTSIYTLLDPCSADEQGMPSAEQGLPAWRASPHPTLITRNKTQGRRAPQPGQNGRHGYDFERLVETPGLDDADAAE